jgi:hypothetical protein
VFSADAMPAVEYAGATIAAAGATYCAELPGAAASNIGMITAPRHMLDIIRSPSLSVREQRR